MMADPTPVSARITNPNGPAGGRINGRSENTCDQAYPDQNWCGLPSASTRTGSSRVYGLESLHDCLAEDDFRKHHVLLLGPLEGTARLLSVPSTCVDALRR